MTPSAARSPSDEDDEHRDPVLTPELRLAIAASYAEGAVTAIARAASRQAVLKHFYTTLYMPRISRFVPAPMRRLVGPDTRRRAFPGLEEGTIETLAVGSEVLRIATMRIPRMQPLATRAMYSVARRFDRAVARKLTTADVNAVVAMYTSAEATTAAAGRRGILSILNVVSAYPRARNRLLTELAGLPAGHHELVPPRMQQAIEAALDSADILLVPSGFVAGQLLDAGIPEDKIVHQSYGVDLDRFASLARSTRDDGHERGRLRCLFVGQISHIKGVPVLAEAARRLSHRQVEFRLVGPVVSPDVLENLPPNVSYDGPLAHAAVANAMLDADVFVLPSLVDAFPLVVVEAMACGLPVVVTTNTGSRELLDDDSGIVVQSGEVGPLADALERLIDDSEARRRMGVAARRRVQASSWDAYGDAVVQLISGRLDSDRGQTQKLLLTE